MTYHSWSLIHRHRLLPHARTVCRKQGYVLFQTSDAFDLETYVEDVPVAILAKSDDIRVHHLVRNNTLYCFVSQRGRTQGAGIPMFD